MMCPHQLLKRPGAGVPIPSHLTGGVDTKVANLVEAAVTLEPADFCSHQILDRVPWLFDDRATYIGWKQSLAEALRVDPYAICVVGSAATGVSLSPTKDFALFHERSDIDVAVISHHHFDLAWRKIRDLSLQPKLLSNTKREKIERHRRGLLFDGCIATDKILSMLEYGPAWQDALLRAGKNPPVVGHTVKARLYRDFESLRAYQLRSARHAREELV